MAVNVVRETAGYEENRKLSDDNDNPHVINTRQPTIDEYHDETEPLSDNEDKSVPLITVVEDANDEYEEVKKPDSAEVQINDNPHVINTRQPTLDQDSDEKEPLSTIKGEHKKDNKPDSGSINHDADDMMDLSQKFDTLRPTTPTVYAILHGSEEILCIHPNNIKFTADCFVETANVNMVAEWKNESKEYMHCVFMIPMRGSVTHCFINIGSERLRTIGLAEKVTMIHGQMYDMEEEEEIITLIVQKIP